MLDVNLFPWQDSKQCNNSESAFMGRSQQTRLGILTVYQETYDVPSHETVVPLGKRALGKMKNSLTQISKTSPFREVVGFSVGI